MSRLVKYSIARNRAEQSRRDAPMITRILRLAGDVFLVGFFFLSCTQIVAAQFQAWFIFRPFSVQLYKDFVRKTEESWALFLVGLTQALAPSEVTITYDDSVKYVESGRQSLPTGQTRLPFEKDTGGNIIGHLSERAIVMANHQVYAVLLI